MSTRTLTRADLRSWLQRCTSANAISEGMRVHHAVVEHGHERDSRLSNTILQMYSLCGDLEDARAIFDSSACRDKFSWMFMISAYINRGEREIAFHFLHQMQSENYAPDKFIVTSLLSACANLMEGMYVHMCIVKDESEQDVFTGTSLLHMYAKCRSLGDACHVFDNMAEKNLLSWTAMITAYVHLGLSEGAVRVFHQMQKCGEIPDKVAITSLLGVFTAPETMEQARRIHASIVCSEGKGDVAIGNALLTMYGKLHHLDKAWEVFSRLPQKDTISWTAIIGLYADSGQSRDALHLFQQMLLHGVPANRVTYVTVLSACGSSDLEKEARLLHTCITETHLLSDMVIGNALLNMYARGGSIRDARAVFGAMPKRNVITWTAMIAGYAHHELGDIGIEHFCMMTSRGIEPNSITFTSVISACTHQTLLVWGKLIHHHVACNDSHVDDAIRIALIHMYGRCGSLKEAQSIFDKTSNRDVHAWASLITAYARNGLGQETLFLFRKMKGEGVRPDGVTFLDMLLACCHAGLVDEGHSLFVSMVEDYGITPSVDHYHCLIDLYGRVGRLDAAKSMMGEMPHGPTPVAWMTFLGACKTLVDVEQAEHAADRLIKLQPQNPKPYVVLSNIYAAIARGDDAAATMDRLRGRCLA